MIDTALRGTGCDFLYVDWSFRTHESRQTMGQVGKLTNDFGFPSAEHCLDVPGS